MNKDAVRAVKSEALYSLSLFKQWGVVLPLLVLVLFLVIAWLAA